MMAAADPKTFGQSRFEQKQLCPKQKGSPKKKNTRVSRGNRLNRRLTLVNDSIRAEEDCQKEKRLIDFGDWEEKHKPKPMRTVLVLREFWNLYDTELFKMIASHLDLSSLKIFMFLSKNIYNSLFDQKSSDNSWAIPFYYKYFMRTCTLEKGIQRAVDTARIVNPRARHQPPFFCKKDVDDYITFCDCDNCKPEWMMPDQPVGWISYSHEEVCEEPYCDCGFAPDCFGPESHCNWKKKTEMSFLAKKRTPFYDKNGDFHEEVEVSMTPVALKRFNEFSLSEVIKLDKKNFRINRWFRFASLLSGRIERAFIHGGY